MKISRSLVVSLSKTLIGIAFTFYMVRQVATGGSLTLKIEKVLRCFLIEVP